MNLVQPIRDKKKIDLMKILLRERSEKYLMLFDFGINSGLRISDILKLKVEDVEGVDHITVKEKKTGKQKRFLINRKFRKEVETYIRTMKLGSGDYLFPSRKGENKPISRVQAYRVLSECGKQADIEEVGTHTLRKTFGYWYYQKYHDVAMLQNIFNHSAPSVTLRYIGITDEMKDKTLEDFYL